MSKLPILCRLRVKNDDNTFYSYNVRGADMWFTQENRSGNIYSVSVSLPSHLDEFEVFVRDGSRHNVFYPECVEIQGRFTTVSENLEDYVKKITEVQAISNSIMEVFNFEEHKSAYNNHHN